MEEEEKKSVLSKFQKRFLLDSSERVEIAYYEFLRTFMDRLVQGFFIFKTRKGELLAGATTFFVLMALSPLLLLVITFYGKAVGNVDEAYGHVMLSLKQAIPQMAPWIYDSLEKIIKSQLSQDSLNTVNILLLLYSGSGLSGTLVFGMNNIADIKQRGGWLVETFKSLLSAAFVTGVIVLALVLSFHSELVVFMFRDIPFLSFMAKMATKGAAQTILFLGVLTCYFKFITAKKIRYSDGLTGAMVTLACFAAAKSFYWIYIHYMKAELQQSFGNFYTMIVAVLYVYFMICSFFYGASVAFAPSYNRVAKKAAGDEDDSIGETCSELDADQKDSDPPNIPMAG